MAPVVEFTAYVLAVIMLVSGITTLEEILTLVFLAYATSVFFTLIAILTTETSRLSSSSWKDYGKMILAVFIDNFGWHQIRVFTSVWATIQFIFLGRRDLGSPIARTKRPSLIQP
jgi:hypothetical protein